MAKGYWVSVYSKIHNPDGLAAYAQLAAPAILAAGGKFLARGIPTKVADNGIMERLVLVEFESVEKAVAAYESPDYQAALKALGQSVERDFRIIEGLE